MSTGEFPFSYDYHNLTERNASPLVILISVEVILMAKKTKTGTDIQQVKKQNAGQYGTEFASETNFQEVRKQNQKAESNKSQN